MEHSSLNSNNPYIIAECAYSHEGNPEYLRRSIQTISETGCINAAKFHVLLDIDTYMCRDHDLYGKINKWLFTNDKWQELIEYAYVLGLDIVVLADDIACLDFLKSTEDKLVAVEIHSCSLNDIKMLNEVSKFSIPVILGIGGSTIDQISFAVDYLKKKEKSEIILMYGFQNFPTKYEHINFRKMQKIKRHFNLPIGYADHTWWKDENQELVTIAGFLCGANVIEKHFVLVKGENRIDYEAAISAEDFCSLHKRLYMLAKVIGNGEMEMNEYEKAYGEIGPMKKAIVAEKDIEKDERISLENTSYKRTKNISNIEQKQLLNLLRRKAKNRIKKDELISFENTYPNHKNEDSLDNHS